MLLDLVEGRHAKPSLILTSQYPVDTWHERIGDQTVADAVLDRIIHSAHRIELTGESMRRKKQTITNENREEKRTSTYLVHFHAE